MASDRYRSNIYYLEIMSACHADMKLIVSYQYFIVFGSALLVNYSIKYEAKNGGL